jgi:DNA-directed RNA polymerase specialized sigma24 family protein
LGYLSVGQRESVVLRYYLQGSEQHIAHVFGVASSIGDEPEI